MTKKRLYVFDFDGTLTTRDTLLEFIRYACGTWRFVVGFLLHSPLLVLMKLGLYPNYRAKQQIFSWFFRGMEIAEFNRLCRDFASEKDWLMRPKGCELLADLFPRGESICIVSASIDNWVRPFFDLFVKVCDADFHVLGTQIETDNSGRITGKFSTKNCYGNEKVRRLCEVYPELTEHREAYYIEAFGDSNGDKEMLEFADIAHYKPFR